MNKKTTLLTILDGWGHRKEQHYNAIAHAKTPNWDRISGEYPSSLLGTSGEYVGLPKGQMGNSEVGHMNIGSGRIMKQILPRINHEIDTNNLAQNQKLISFSDNLIKTGGSCHLFGLLSDGGVHAHMNHIIALAKILSKQNIKVNIHAFLDGRDTAPKSAADFVEQLNSELENDSNIKLSSISGRYYAMDRDNNWDRIQKYYGGVVNCLAPRTDDFITTIKTAYNNKITDEFVEPNIATDYQGIKDGDGFLSANFRADRARQISSAFLSDEFNGFARDKKNNFSAQLSMTSYSDELDKYLPCMFPSEIPENTLSDILEQNNKTQLHIAETEKYAHVTFFFNGGQETPKQGEERILINSPNVATYDMQPAMSAPEVTEQLVTAIRSQKYDFIVVNFANPDMVGHSGIWEAAITAVEQIDQSLGILEQEILAIDGKMLITADHGNIEEMYDEKKQSPHTAHTLNPVPCVIVKKDKNFSLDNGKLCDIAPTILKMMELEQPNEMTGKNLINE